MKRKRKTILGKWFLVLVAPLLALGALEALVRVMATGNVYF